MLFALTFVVMIVGFVPWQNFGIDLFMLGGSADDPSGAWSAFLTGTPLGSWYFNEATAWFLLMGIVIGVLARLSGKDIVGTFLGGCAEMVSVALVIALARSVAVVMSETALDTFILENAANALAGVPNTRSSVRPPRSCSTSCCPSPSRQARAWPRSRCPSWGR